MPKSKIPELFAADNNALTKITLTGRIVPKPRCNARRQPNSHRYRKWREEAVKQLKKQWISPPLDEALVYVAVGNCTPSSEQNGLSGAIIDALKEAGVIMGDSIAKVPCLIFEYDPNLTGITTISLSYLKKKEPPVTT